MSYVKDNLMAGEKVLFTARIHYAVFLPSIVAFLITIASFTYGFSNAAIIGESGSPSPEATASNFAGTMILFISGIMFLGSIWLVIEALIIITTTEFAVTNRRLIAKKGFIRRHTLEMLLSKIESVSVDQDVLGRILNVGTVTVTGTGGTQGSFRAIIDPIGVRKKINRIIEGYMRYQQKLANQRAG